MSALTLQMFGVPAAGQRLSPTGVEASDDFAAAMANAEAAGFAAKDGLSDEMPLPDPALLVAPQMILVGPVPPPAMPERTQMPQVQVVDAASPESVVLVGPIAEPPAVPPSQPLGAELGPQPDDLPVAAMPSQALPPEVLPAAAGLPHFTLPGMLLAVNMPALPAAVFSHALSLPEPQQKRFAANQIAELPMYASGLQEKPIALGQTFARSLPDLGVSVATPPKWRASGQADLSAMPVSDVESGAPAHQVQGDGAHLQDRQAAPTLAETATPALAKVSAMPGTIVALGAAMGDLPQRDPDLLMLQSAPDHLPLRTMQAQTAAIAGGLVQLLPSTRDLPFASDWVTPQPEPAAGPETAQVIPRGKVAMAVPNVPIVPEATATVQLPEPIPDDAHLPETMPTGAQKPANPAQPVAGSSAESAWQTRLQMQRQPEAMQQVVQPVGPPDLTLLQKAVSAITPAILPDDTLAVQPPALPLHATAGDLPTPAMPRAAEATHPFKATPIGDPAEARVTLADAAFVSSLATPGSTIRPESGDVVNPLVLKTVLAPKLAAQIMPMAQRAEAGPVEVLLHPEELGAVRFQIHQHGDSVRVVLCVERPETLDLVRRHADQLMQEFRQAGFSGATLSFGSWAQQGGQPDTPPQPPAMLQPEDLSFIAPAAVRAATPSAAQYGGHGLNLRL